MIDGNSKVYGFATNLAVLHVFLEPNGTVHDYLNALTAIGASEVNCFQQTHGSPMKPIMRYKDTSIKKTRGKLTPTHANSLQPK